MESFNETDAFAASRGEGMAANVFSIYRYKESDGCMLLTPEVLWPAVLCHATGGHKQQNMMTAEYLIMLPAECTLRQYMDIVTVIIEK